MNTFETDYENAKEVIKRCLDYAKSKIGDLTLNEDFQLGLLMTEIDEDDECKISLMLCGDCGLAYKVDYKNKGLSVMRDFDSGNFYKTRKFQTIDTAYRLAKNWDFIKKSISDKVDGYIKDVTKRSKVIEEFLNELK